MSLGPFLAPRRNFRSLAASAAVTWMMLTGVVVPAEAATIYSAPLRTTVKSRPVASKNNTGYDRTRYFGDWKDANCDCHNTRLEVLQVQSKALTTFTTSRYCMVKNGKWVTSWDNRTHFSATAVQQPHCPGPRGVWLRDEVLDPGPSGGVIQRPR